ncbi:MAG TPA: hypothetical protein VII61_12180 [Ktedonobacteraceae bacterium]
MLDRRSVALWLAPTPDGFANGILPQGLRNGVFTKASVYTVLYYIFVGARFIAPTVRAAFTTPVCRQLDRDMTHGRDNRARTVGAINLAPTDWGWEHRGRA